MNIVNIHITSKTPDAYTINTEIGNLCNPSINSLIICIPNFIMMLIFLIRKV